MWLQKKLTKKFCKKQAAVLVAEDNATAIVAVMAYAAELQEQAHQLAAVKNYFFLFFLIFSRLSTTNS